MTNEMPEPDSPMDLLPWEGGPLCSRRLPPDFAELFLYRARLLGAVADACGPADRNAREQYSEEARRDRDLAWSILPGDQIWLTVDPQASPEVKSGVTAIVVVRDGQIVTKKRLAAY